MPLTLGLGLGLALAGCGRAADAPGAAMSNDPHAVVAQRLAAKGLTQNLSVTSPAFAPGGTIPAAYVDASPPLAWSAAPGAKAYAVIVEDPDAPGRAPFVHWKLWNVGPATTALPKGLPSTARAPQLPGAVQGRNDAGGFGYYGPHPPPGAPHHYHFQVFALDQPIGADPQADLDELVATMKGHVIAEGELVGTFQGR